jgi:hypothetical protein
VPSGGYEEVIAALQAQLVNGVAPGLLRPKPQILVCAPSHAATDELLERVLRDGFVDGEGHTYRPAVSVLGERGHNMPCKFPKAGQV